MNPQSSDHESDELTNYSTPRLPLILHRCWSMTFFLMMIFRVSFPCTYSTQKSRKITPKSSRDQLQLYDNDIKFYSLFRTVSVQGLKKGSQDSQKEKRGMPKGNKG